MLSFTLLFACGGGGGGSESALPVPVAGAGEVGRVAILLTHAPTETLDEVNVSIAEVYLLQGENKVQLPVDADRGPLNLLALRDSAELLFDVAEVPAGCYNKIRLVVTRK